MPDSKYANLDGIERYCVANPDLSCDLPTEQVLDMIHMLKARHRTVPSGIYVEVQAELERARKKFGAFPTEQHGYAVILEEMDELWDEIRHKVPSVAAMRKEAIQVAAMAVRFTQDVCDQ